MTRSLTATVIAMAALCGSTSWALADMAADRGSGSAPLAGSQVAADSKTKTSTSASASSSASAGKQGCEANAKSSAEAAAGDKRAYDSDEKTARDSGDGCSASAHSSATASSGDEDQDPKKPN